MKLGFFLLSLALSFARYDGFLHRFSYSSGELSSLTLFKKYPLSQNHYERYIKRINSKNHTIQNYEIANGHLRNQEENVEDLVTRIMRQFNETDTNSTTNTNRPRGFRIVLNKSMFQNMANQFPGLNGFEEDGEEETNGEEEKIQKEKQNNNENDHPNIYYDAYGNPIRTFGRRAGNQVKSSENFQIITKSPISFCDVGGYQNIKRELEQCIDILANYTKYAPYNVRTPKGLILEGPPGNGKTLLAKALAGEANTSFITVSGSEFQEKYVGVGSSRIRELFKLATANIPCIIFIDEIDALGRKRSSDGDTSGNERDSTLNELLVALDGFKNTSGVFVIGATNRADLLDSALTRPGRIDKRIYIGNPDSVTRKAVLEIHSKGKPYDSSVIIEDLVELTNGLSCAEIENLTNEAMLNALRHNRNQFTSSDLDVILNKMLAGWQPTDHEFTTNVIDQIAIHELGHCIVGLLSTHHSKMTKVIINLSAPNSPAYTVFESSASNILTREALFEHLMILLGGRIAEEAFYGVSVSTGAINDFQEALKLAEKMVCYYGMGKKLIYPSTSDKYKEIIDTEVAVLIQDAYEYSEYIIRNAKGFIQEGANMLKQNKVVKAETLNALIRDKYKHLLDLKV
uniref:AAA+ ATPase domain-containing protein n=1 Tax=viral metagenome TaxID=1070528 RepID=A0A6C0LG35_9ZZZZ